LIAVEVTVANDGNIDIEMETTVSPSRQSAEDVDVKMDTQVVDEVDIVDPKKVDENDDDG
jgi:hypothetical protein